MPKSSLKNPFARRKSSGNILDTTPTDSTPQSSFRVIERPEKSKIIFDGPDRTSPALRASQVPRPFNSPLQQLRGKSADDLTYLANGSVDTAASRRAAASALKPARGSGGTTNSASSDVYPSSASGRHSSSSTLPSSIEHDAGEEDEELFTQKRPQTAASSPLATRLEEPLPPPPSFSARAQRAFSFGLRSKQAQGRVEQSAPSSAITASSVASSPAMESPTITPAVAPPSPVRARSPIRERALTTSSYASTAVPLKLDTRPDLGTSDFGGDFGSMFDDKPNPPYTSSPAVTPGTHRTDSEPMYPPRSYSRQDFTPSPSTSRPALESSSHHSSRDSASGIPLSAQTSSLAPTFFSAGKQGYSTVPTSNTSPALDRTSASSQEDFFDTGRQTKSPEYPNRQQQLDDEDRWSKIQPQHDTRQSMAVASAPALTINGLDSKPTKAELTMPWDRESSSATPKAAKRESDVYDDDSLFDASPVGRASMARKPVSTRTESAPKKLTKAQFEILQKYSDKSLDPTGESGDEDEDDDELERAKQVTKQRRKQEANMSVYRQQMKKSTGGGPTDLPNRPNIDRASSSATSLHFGGVPSAAPPDSAKPKDDDDEDEDVPLGILQAHGFPSGNRPPTRMGDEPGYRPGSVAARNSQSLPPFARRLPEDPYFGAGLVNPSARESLAFGSGGSVYGGQTSAPPTPGGLVGIIASEERQRQSRRGSPNPVTGTYNSMPLPSNMPPMNRSSSMVSMQAPPFTPGAMPGMPMMPPASVMNDPQMQQFMAMQMQLMQNMQNMIHMQQAQLAQSPVMPQAQPGLPRPMSTASNLPFMQGPVNDQARAMSMMGPPTGGWNQGMKPSPNLDPRLSAYSPSVNGLGPGPGYTPSIAPSERSNVGMPSRYRPVQTGENDGRTNSLTSSMTLNALQFQQENAGERPLSQAPQSKSTIRVIDKPKGAPKMSSRAVDDEDEESSWGDMFKKRAKGKRDRASQSAGDRIALSELYPNVE